MWIAISNAIGQRVGTGGSPGPEPTTPLLDDYPGAAAAYSVRLLSSSYTGDCIEAYRDSDGATQAIGFDGDGALDAAAITAFGGASVVRVRTWYDQSGNNLNAAMTTAANMPIIYDGAAVLVENGKAILTGGQLNYASNITYTNNLHSVFNVLRYDANAIYAASYNAGITNHYGASYRNNALFEKVGGITSFHFLSGTPKAFTQQVVSIIDDATNVVIRVNDVISSVSSIGPYTAVTTLTHRGEFGLSPDVKIQEQVIYLTDQNSNRFGIEGNQNGYFSAYTPVNPDAATSGFLFDYSGASVAFSVRKLNNNATAALRVRRTVSPFDEQDIGFDSNGDLDTAAISAFGGSDPLTVSVWYDQVGGQNHARQDNATIQPQVYDGAAVVSENGKPAVRTVNQVGLLNFFPVSIDTAGGYTTFAAKGSQTDWGNVVTGGPSIRNTTQLQMRGNSLGNVQLYSKIGGGLPNLFGRFVLTGRKNNATYDIYTDTTLRDSRTLSSGNVGATFGQLFKGVGFDPNSVPDNGFCHEVIIYPTALSDTDVTAIQNNLITEFY